MRTLLLATLLFLIAPVAHGYTVFSQNDPEWANYRLGWSDTTIGEYGCFLTSLAMIASNYEDTHIDPLELQDRILELPNGFIYGNGDLAAPIITDVFPDVRVTGALTAREDMIDFNYHRVNEFSLAQTVRARLMLGQYVLAHVDNTPEDAYDHDEDQHWVVLTEVRGNDFLALDPYDGSEILLNERYRKAGQLSSMMSAIFLSSM